jgi:hypothetical protein
MRQTNFLLPMSFKLKMFICFGDAFLGIEEYIKLFVRDIFCFELTVECPQTTV